jgi:hypothetical protein
MARPKNRGVSVRSVRGVTYAAGKFLGDLNALQKGTIGKRTAIRIAGKATGRGLRIFN